MTQPTDEQVIACIASRSDGARVIDGQEIDPASIRYRIAGREYKIGTRVLTPGGLGTVTAFDPSEDYDIGVLLDGQTEIVWTTWEYVEPIRDEANGHAIQRAPETAPDAPGRTEQL